MPQFGGISARNEEFVLWTWKLLLRNIQKWRCTNFHIDWSPISYKHCYGAHTTYSFVLRIEDRVLPGGGGQKEPGSTYGGE